MIVIVDTFDYEDYPKFVMPGEDVRKVASNPGSMQRVMEVYCLAMDKQSQMNEHRAFNYDMLEAKDGQGN